MGISSVLVADWNQDGYDETYWADHKTGEVYFKDSFRGEIKQFHLDDIFVLSGLVDLDGDGKASLCITRMVPDERAWLSFHEIGASSFPFNHEPVLEIGGFENPGYDFRSDHDWVCQLSNCGPADFNGDGTNDLLFLAFTGFELIPRGFWIYDGESLKEGGPPEVLCKREMKCGSFSRKYRKKQYMPFVADVDGDEAHRPEIVVSTRATDNWTDRKPPDDRLPSRLDDRERVLVLKIDSETGVLEEEKCWEPADPNGALSAHLGPMIPGGGYYFYLYRPLREEGGQTGRIEKIRGPTLKPEGKPFRFDRRTNKLLAHFDPSSSFKGLVVTYMDGSIDLLDENLKKTSSRTPRKNLPLTPRLVADLDGDGRDELVATGGNDLLVLSLPDLEIMALRSFTDRVRLVSLVRNGNEIPDLCVRVSSKYPGAVSEKKKIDFFQCRLVEDVLPSPTNLLYMIPSFLAGSAAAAAAVFLAARRRRMNRRKRTAAEASRCDAFLETMRTLGQGRRTDSILDQLRMLFEQLNLDPSPDRSLVKRLNELAVSFHENAGPHLARIPPAARQAGIAPGLVRSFDEALLVLRDVLGKCDLSDTESLASMCGSVLTAIGTLSLVRKRMLEDLAAFIRCDPVRVAEEMLQAAAVNVSEAGVGVEPVAARLKPGVKAFVRESDLKVIIEDLLANASRAMKGSREKKLRLSIDTCGERILIDLSDTGTGIPDDLKNRIFEPGFSTKSGGGGLGLFQAVEMLDRYGGRIFIRRTGPDQGTTVRIELLPA